MSRTYESRTAAVMAAVDTQHPVCQNTSNSLLQRAIALRNEFQIQNNLCCCRLSECSNAKRTLRLPRVATLVPGYTTAPAPTYYVCMLPLALHAKLELVLEVHTTQYMQYSTGHA